MEVRARHAGIWPVLLALLPLLPSWGFVVAKPWLPMSVDDDTAVIEMATRRVLHGTQLVGVYSRFGWSHPGPLPLVLVAPVYAATGRRSAGLALGALVVSTLAVGAAAWSAARLLGPRRGLVAAAGLALLLVRMGPGWPAHVWPPHAVILPFALLLVLALGLAREGAGWLPAIVVVASDVVQSHLGTAPAVACVLAVGLALAARAGRRLLALRPLLLAAVLLAAVWAPPVIEELRGTPAHPGNLTLLWRFFLTHGSSHTFIEIFGSLAHELGSIPVALATAIVPTTTDRRDVGAGAFALLLVALLPLGLAAARRRRDDDASGLSWLALAAGAAAFASGFRVVGEIFEYLLLFASAASFAGWTALALVASRPLEERGRGRLVAGTAVVVTVLAAVANVRGLVPQQPIPVATNASVATFTQALRAHLATAGIRKPLVKILPGEPWVPAAGTLLELDREGTPFSVDEDWAAMFGGSRRATGDEDGTMCFAEEPPGPDVTLLAASGRTKLYAVSRALR